MGVYECRRWVEPVFSFLLCALWWCCVCVCVCMDFRAGFFIGLGGIYRLIRAAMAILRGGCSFFCEMYRSSGLYSRFWWNENFTLCNRKEFYNISSTKSIKWLYTLSLPIIETFLSLLHPRGARDIRTDRSGRYIITRQPIKPPRSIITIPPILTPSPSLYIYIHSHLYEESSHRISQSLSLSPRYIHTEESGETRHRGIRAINASHARVRLCLRRASSLSTISYTRTHTL